MLSLTEKGRSASRPGAMADLRLLLLLSLLCISLTLTATPVLAAGSSASKTTIDSVRLWRAPDHTRLVFDLSGQVEHKIFTLDNPQRLVIDVKQTAFATKPSQLKLANTPITELRSAQFDGDNLRIVLELREKINPRSFVLDRNEQYGDRLVIDLYDRAKHSEKTVGDALLGQKSRDIVIAIDAGHGGEDPGAIGPKRLREKNVVLAISRVIQSMVDREPGFRAVMVRDGDYYIPLRKRTDIARKHRADLMISIHADAFKQASANGASVYALSTRSASSETARYLAKRENRADLIGGVGVLSLLDKDKVLAGVLLDLSMTATLESSLGVGTHVLKSMDGVTRLHKKRVEQAGFVVLKSPDMPSILVETGFISNPKEARRLSQPAYQQKMAKAIFSGVKRYFQQKPPVGTLLAERKHKSGKVHVIARGDTLSDIAQRYRVSVADLRRYNSLKSTRIKIGQRIKIPISS